MSWGLVAVAGATLVTGTMSYLNGKSAQKSADRANASAISAADLQTQIASEQWDRYRNLYMPLEDKLVKGASEYDSPQNYALQAGNAAATVAEQFGKARQQLLRTPGLDPSSPAYQSQMTNLGLQEAVASATEQNNARRIVGDTAYSRQLAALGLGKGLDSTAASGLASAANTQTNIANNTLANAGNESKAIGEMVGNLGAVLSKINYTGNNTGLTGNAYQNVGQGVRFSNTDANVLYQ